MNAIDTNIFVYAIDSDESEKRAVAKALLLQLVSDQITTVVPWQVVGEFLSCMRRWESQSRISKADIEANISDLLRSFPIRIPGINVVHRLLSLSARHSISHWDSMLLAACIEAGVSTLYSEDLTAGEAYDSVTVVNPFR